MIKRLKRRFIVLAMVSLTILLTVIVAGMNIINYEKVVSDADARIEVLEENTDRLFGGPGAGGPFMGLDNWGEWDDSDDFFFGGKDRGGPSMSRDEAEESRFFMVKVSSDGTVQYVNTDRIYSIDDSEAEEYAQKALDSGRDEGFIGDFRYNISDSGTDSMITFLDCGRVLGSFRSFLRASIMMSLIGLLVVFAVICYFAGRIVRPVAESYEKQKRFITDAGHEIKTPLAIIKANIDLMDMELDSKKVDREELRENLGDINDQIDRLTGLTNDLVYLSRMEEAESSLVLTEVPLSDIVSETVSSFRPLAGEQDKAIWDDIEPMVSVQGSHKELEKLLSILLENAIKYSPPAISREAAAPLIKVTLKKEGKNAVLEVANPVKDEITNESLSHVFERFYRADASRNSATGGHGIGLSMANAIVSAHKGKISARTTDGHDFIITAVIPA